MLWSMGVIYFKIYMKGGREGRRRGKGTERIEKRGIC